MVKGDPLCAEVLVSKESLSVVNFQFVQACDFGDESGGQTVLLLFWLSVFSCGQVRRLVMILLGGRGRVCLLL